jgi:hypothetical protein
MMKALRLIFLFLLNGYAMSTIAEDVSLNGTWQFKTDLYNQGVEAQWYLPQTRTAGWDVMEVPGCWDTRNEYAEYVGNAWYRTTFKSGADWKKKAVRLYFEAVYNDVQVWLNGEKLGEHHVGFLPFWFDVQERLRYDEPNVLVLQVDNTFKRGALWNWGGIRRPVKLEITDRIRIEYQHITAVPDLRDGSAELVIEYALSNFNDQSGQVEARFQVTRAGVLIWDSGQENVNLPAGRETRGSVRTRLPSKLVELWDFNHPNLYECSTTISQDGRDLHAVADRFGIRKIEVDGEQLKLNGQVIRTVGFNVVPDDRTNGSSLPMWRIKEDVDILKSLGCNMARISHTPIPKEYLDYLDEVGIMTFEEVSLWGKDVMVDPEHPLPKYWLEKMIRVKYNHPSVIGWSVGNEIGYLHANPKVMEYVEGAVAHAKSLDSTRLVAYVSNSAHAQKIDPVRYSDLILYNTYGSWGENVEKIHELHPGKPIFMLEYGNHLNSEDPDKAHIDAAGMIDQFRGKPYMAGVSLWTFNDYRSFWKSRPTWTTPPSQNRTWGVVTVFRKPKKPFYGFKREYAPVRDMQVKLVSGQMPGQDMEIEVKIEPRGILDIPAYAIEDYRLIGYVLDKDRQIVSGNLKIVPKILPGDPTNMQHMKLRGSGPDVQSLYVGLLDPKGYAVLDTVVHLAIPEPPQITGVHSASHTIRVHFSEVDNATGYKLVYTGEEVQGSAKATLNDFIEITDLEYGKAYDLRLTAVNSAGESNPSPIVSVETDEDELPPIIWANEASDKGFFVGYSVENTDYLYEVEYGTEPGTYDHQIGLRNVGVLEVPGLINGTEYFYRLRVRKQWGFASEWSQELSIRPDGGLPPEAPEVKGVVQHGKDVVVCLQPSKKATGYKLEIHGSGGRTVTRDHAGAAMPFLLLERMDSRQIEAIEIRSVNENGMSEPVRIENIIK